MESTYTKLAPYGSQNELAMTDNVFFPISEVCDGTVSLQTHLLAFLGFPVETIIKVDTKLTDVMCCHLFDKRCAAPSSSNFRRRPSLPQACELSLRQLEKQSPSKLSDLFMYFLSKNKKKSNLIFFIMLNSVYLQAIQTAV